MKLRFELKITLLYLLLGGLWILFSDKLLLSITQNKEALTQLQTYKGWFFIIITGLFFYSFVRKQLIKLERSEKHLEKTNKEIKKVNQTLIRKTREIEQINRELEYSRDKAMESDRLKTAFLENMSHEIRTPLNGIVGFSELICEKGISDAERLEFSSIINSNSQQLLEIIHDILDISSLRTGQVRISNTPVSVSDLLDEIHIRWNKEAEYKSITFPKPHLEKDIILRSDYQALKKIIDKLVHNALKYTAKGSVSLNVFMDEEILNVNISDTGIGIAPEETELIFEPFYQVNTAGKDLNSGNGLGLSIAKEYAAGLKGRVICRSTPGKGSVFTLKVPVSEQLHEISGIPERDEVKITPKAKGKTVLIVEDEFNNYLYLNEILKPLNVNIYHAHNGSEAVEYIRNNPVVDLILMDIKMPVLNGYEATRIIKDLNPEVPVIAQTAHAMSGDREKALESGCCDYLTKPLKREDLIELVTKHLK